MATLVYSDADGIDRSFSLGLDPVMVGRGAECAIRSDDPRVSRLHARFFVDNGALWVEDLGSSNGIYVGPNKVQRAPVPIGEIVLVGSLMIRLLPVSGTLPPPMGLHGTLAQWLEMERKARATVEEERDAFARRVGELHEELRPLRDAHAVHETDATKLRDELDSLRRASVKDLELARLELAKAREAKMIAETQAGITTAERLAEADMMISGLQHQLDQAKAAAGAGPAAQLGDQVAAATARADKADKELVAAQIRAQGAERNLAGANMQAAKAETRVAELASKLAEADPRRATAETELAASREKIAALETRLGAGDAPVQAAEARAAKLAAELAELQQQFETRRDRLVELETTAAAATAAAAAAKAEATEVDKRAQAELGALADKLAAAQAQTSELEERLRQAGTAEAEIATARKAREEARELAAGAERRIADAVARVEEGDKRASAADTMAKAMAKDVAEALRRAVDADSRARSVARELDGAHRRAEAAEKRDAERQAATRDAERRAAEAEARVVSVQRELGDQLEAARLDLNAKADQVQKDLAARLDQSQRELAAERATAMSLVDRKTALERDLTEARTLVAGLQARALAAEAKVAEYEIVVDALEDRVQDLESGIAVEQTASESSVADAQERIKKLEDQLGEAKAASKTATKTAAGLEKRVEALDTELRGTSEARAAAEAGLAEARQRIAELEHATEEHVGTSQADRDRLADLERRANDAESRLEPLIAKAEAADLALGRAGAVQRQLDEALQKLSYLERASQPRVDEAQAAAAEARARQAEAHAREVEGQKQALEAMVRDAEAGARQAQREADEARAGAAELEARIREASARARDIETRAKDAAERIVDAERRAREAQAQLAAAEQRARLAESQLADGLPTQDKPGSDRQLADALAKIAALQREVEKADNVRQFAANTEREIAALERELRETKAKLAQLTLERDRMESQLRDVREDSETTNRRAAMRHEPDVTVQADLSRYTALVARSTELEQKLVRMEKDDEKLRRQLAQSEARLAAQHRAKEDEPTNTGNALPLAYAEHLGVLEESIDSLRANMRAASDETAMMTQSDSVIAVASAVSSAAEHVERARDALKVLTAMVGHK